MANFKSILLAFLFILLGGFTHQSIPDSFVDLKKAIPDIQIDLRYFSSDNFIGDTIDGYHANKCIISTQAAQALAKVQKNLKNQGYGLKVFDAYRPQRAVNHFLRWGHDLSDTRMKDTYYPEVDKKLLFVQGYISNQSGHSRGSTVDLTLVYLSGYKMGQEVDMGTSWDFFSPKSWPSSDAVSPSQKANRYLLQKVMIAHGFRPYNAEWWHFTLRNEPFPKTYFDFPIE